jgi:hypothetical protein
MAHAAPQMPVQSLPLLSEPPLLAAGVARIALTAPPPPVGSEVAMTTDGSNTARTWRPEPH